MYWEFQWLPPRRDCFMREQRCVSREGLNRCEKDGSPAEAFASVCPRMVEANRVFDACARRFSSMGKNTASRGTNVAEENVGDRLSATTSAKDRDVSFLAPLPGAIKTVTFAGRRSLYLNGANRHLKH